MPLTPLSIADSESPSRRTTARSDVPLAIGLSAALIFFVIGGVLTYRNAHYLMDDATNVARTHEVITALEGFLSYVKDAESSQRGYIITGDESYLAPYHEAKAGIESQLANIENLVGGSSTQKNLLARVRTHLASKYKELEETIAVRRISGFDPARDIMLTDRGRREMNALREKIGEMVRLEKEARRRRVESMQQAYRVAVATGISTALLGILLAIFFSYLLRRAAVARKRQEWLQAGRVGLAEAMAGDQPLPQLGTNILGFLAKYAGAHAGALFPRDGAGFKRVSTYGVAADSKIPERFEMNDGLLGRAAAAREPILIHDVPEDFLTVGSGLGRGKPRHLIIFPATTDGAVNAVLELGFFDRIDEAVTQFLAQIAEPIGTAVKSANYRENLQQLLEETQRQSEELQTQSEELRVSNEELEEQSRALKESQSRLEQQQAELEQTNSQLEQQAQLLEVQKDDLSQAKVLVESKAEELERASQYKSDFLANMSHELRTPLNSLLILSKLLADNPEENLNAEQVDFARTIHNSGNDLLVLINDILDLSKIEAGHMEIHPEPMPLDRLVGDLRRLFEPVAAHRGLKFTATLDPSCPDVIETDRQRLEQILKNLLSNACKFTEQGEVELVISCQEAFISFAVRDTGIGISPDNQRGIFEAFHQADATISRRYGGTGLGLSISRELARLLGGGIKLASTPGQGSTFTLVLPEKYHGGTAEPNVLETPPAPVPKPPAPSVAPATSPSAYLKDDRENFTTGRRSILVVEDDPTFTKILYDMAHEQGFQCLATSTAEDALIAARQYLPSAILLDVGLPDNSGLTVLDRLKQDTRTRHIPIHVISANDYSRKALSLGAVGYMLKPVRREEIVDALKQLEARLDEGMRHVLIVEDDAIQRESLCKLLGSHEVETIAVGTAGECLEQLESTTFDCMVLDLSLPDASGYSLLETLSQEHNYSFPPVIVYTGRDLTSAEEQKLRRYSKSIIIKGAKSPERLLDEVTLFLHRVVADLPAEQQNMLKRAQNRDAVLEGRNILLVEDDVRNIYSLTNILEPRGALIHIARNGREAIEALEKGKADPFRRIHLVLMDVMMPEMDGLTATREIRKDPEWKNLPIIMLTAKAMKSDQERCLAAGANDYMAKPLEVEKLLSLVRVWMPR